MGEGAALKNGDLCFVHHPADVQLFCKVSSVGDNEIRLWVINGYYELRITKAPEGVSSDYNEAINTFRETRKWR